MGCFECCIKCLGGVPYASLVATMLCFSGVALFCGCGHVALTGTLTMLENHFSRITSDHATLAAVIQIFQYVIYGIASFFFVYAILLLGEGFYTTSTIKKELQSDFKTTICGRCITAFFMFLTYIFALVFIAIFCFTAIPVFLFFNMWNTCAAMRSPDSNITYPDSICVDVRQYGVIPLNATPGKACGTTLTDICSTSEFYLSYHLYIVALAGAGATVIALVSCSDNPPLKICTLPWHAYLLPWQPRLSRKCVVLSAEILPRGLLCERVCVWCERLCFTPLWRWTFVFCIQGNGDAKKKKKVMKHLNTRFTGSPALPFCFLIF
uniref:Glycoprotein M6Ba n=1 Tax=Poecilia reticulata TaxID=8081 RepID=A0A3P9P9J7_POERE